MAVSATDLVKQVGRRIGSLVVGAAAETMRPELDAMRATYTPEAVRELYEAIDDTQAALDEKTAAIKQGLTFPGANKPLASELGELNSRRAAMARNYDEVLRLCKELPEHRAEYFDAKRRFSDTMNRLGTLTHAAIPEQRRDLTNLRSELGRRRATGPTSEVVAVERRVKQNEAILEALETEQRDTAADLLSAAQELDGVILAMTKHPRPCHPRKSSEVGDHERQARLAGV